MLNVDTIKNGLVIDHIRAGSGWRIFQWLGLDKAPFCAALIMNVPSKKSGKKDLIKIDNIMNIDFSVLGFIDPDICVNIIQDEKIVKKINMELPTRVQSVFRCKNPRCITISEQYVTPTFLLVDKKNALYRCEYCDTLYKAGEDARPAESLS
ncbi:MAG: aspartate carbamoyltransferase regulatory subunit [Treponemataceae bacterium]|nr:aspartate carbamoyltransferase regulatory subunit [Treponemataceae bacterium]